jgi:hypothetical protein
MERRRSASRYNWGRRRGHSLDTVMRNDDNGGKRCESSEVSQRVAMRLGFTFDREELTWRVE